MTSARDVPVVLLLFNRPETLARVVDVLRVVRPRLILAIADGPRPDAPLDPERCRAARAIVERLDWPCEIVRDFAEANLGCNARITSGLDRAFREVPEAIIVEDDIVPDPTFFPWCARMLDRYRDDPAVAQVSGRNHLGRWTEAGDGHCLVRRASVWGWATWRRAWQRRASDRAARDATARVMANGAIDPLLTDHFLMLQELLGWDTDWELDKALADKVSVVPSVNLVAHIGHGPSGSHNRYERDLRALTPVGRAPAGAAADRCVVDRRLDRWTVLLELMARYRVPDLARRLARSAHLLPAGPWSGGRQMHHCLAPFRDPHEAIAVIEHFRAAGAPAAPLADLLCALRRAAADAPAAPARLDGGGRVEAAGPSAA